MMGIKRPSSMTSPVSIFQNGVLSPSPSKPEPLLADAEVNSYSISDKPVIGRIIAASLCQDFADTICWQHGSSCQNQQRMQNHHQGGNFHFPGFYFFTHEIRRSPNHLTGNKYRHDHKDEEIDEAHAYTSIYGIDEHVQQKYSTGKGCMAIVHGVDRTVGSGWW